MRLGRSRECEQKSGEGGRHGSRGQEEVLLQVPKKQEQVYICGEHGPGLGGASTKPRRWSGSLPIFPQQVSSGRGRTVREGHCLQLL